MFSKKKDEDATKNVPIYTTDTIIVPDGYTFEYVGIVLYQNSAPVESTKAMGRYQKVANESGADAIFGFRIATPSTLSKFSDAVMYGTGVKFVEA